MMEIETRWDCSFCAYQHDSWIEDPETGCAKCRNCGRLISERSVSDQFKTPSSILIWFHAFEGYKGVPIKHAEAIDFSYLKACGHNGKLVTWKRVLIYNVELDEWKEFPVEYVSVGNVIKPVSSPKETCVVVEVRYTHLVYDKKYGHGICTALKVITLGELLKIAKR